MVDRLNRQQSWQLDNTEQLNDALEAEDLQLTSMFSILEVKDIKKLQIERAKEVSDELGISENLARALLIKNGWGRQEAIDAILSDPDYIAKEFKFNLNFKT